MKKEAELLAWLEQLELKELELSGVSEVCGHTWLCLLIDVSVGGDPSSIERSKSRRRIAACGTE